LAKQIEQGAPADIFFSADLDWMDYLEQKKLIDPASRHTLLGNTLVLIAPKDSDVSLVIEKNFPLLPALGADGKLAMASVDTVPAGKYGKAALTYLGVWMRWRRMWLKRKMPARRSPSWRGERRRSASSTGPTQNPNQPSKSWALSPRTTIRGFCIRSR